MSTPKRRARPAVCFRPRSEALEARQLLTTVIRGVDLDGDSYVLALLGPGDLTVINQPGPDGLPVPLGEPALIASISIGGANPGSTRLVGRVTPGASGDGRVFFQNLVELPSLPLPGAVGNGLLAVDIPDFWLGDTSPEIAPGQGEPVGSIDIPDGVVTLRFGGVDTSAFFGTVDSQRLDLNNRNDRFAIDLGLPKFAGTSVIVDRVVTSNQAPADPTGAPTTNTVNFTIQGRLNTFQANQIVGDPTLNLQETGRFEGNNVGGTVVASVADQQSGTTGSIGLVRILGDATNLGVQTTGPSDNARITEFHVGGETNKVTVVAPTSLRTVRFGKGMDTVSLQAGEIESLSTNRGAVSSTVLTNGSAGRLTFGGDVLNTRVLSGYTIGQDGEPVATEAGNITALVAGDVIDSTFAASVQPLGGAFGLIENLVLPLGGINAKVEGIIDNTFNPEVDPELAGDRAFFAQTVRLESGPIVPPGVPEPPLPAGPEPGRTPTVTGIGGGPRGPIFQVLPNLAERLARRNAPRPAG
ncbi:hypothetical protein BH23PLA1_BH23PLA1_44300 [soil metagenome]